MGNSSSKGSKESGSNNRRNDASAASSSRHDAQQAATEAIPSRPTYSSRARRHSRQDLTSFLGIGGNSEQDPTTLEGRRETKQERETRKLEKERVTRLKERERSMKEEHVDGGYLVTQGVYTGIEDFNKPMVRQLMVGALIVKGEMLADISRLRDDWPPSGEDYKIFQSHGPNIN